MVPSEPEGTEQPCGVGRAQRGRAQQRERNDLVRRLASLTPRERQVLELVTTGMLNKQIAAELGAAEKTIKVHRGRIMEKMQVRTATALVGLLSRAERRGGRAHISSMP